MQVPWNKLLTRFFVLFLAFMTEGSQDTENKHNLSYFVITRMDTLVMTEVRSGGELEGLLGGLGDGYTLHVLLHGLGGSYNHTSNWLLANALFDIGEKKIMAVDYEHMVPAKDYDKAVESCQTAGAELATFLADVTLTIQLIGFSLGAHIAGIAGHVLKTRHDQVISRIIGLDPANPVFESLEPPQRLDYTDAAFVMVIHTAGGAMGGLQPVGHVDFYPNGGKEPQPKCVLTNIRSNLKALIEIMCSHSSSYLFLADSVRGGYTATRCSSWEDYVGDKCLGAPTLHMGFRVPDNARGSYFLSTDTGGYEVLTDDYQEETSSLPHDLPSPLSSDSDKESKAWELLNAFLIIISQILCIYLIYRCTPH